MKIASYLPAMRLDNQQLENPSWPAEKIYNKTGIRSRHICAADEYALDLAEKACNKLFAAGVDKNCIDYVIYCTQSPDHILPNNVSYLAARLDLREDIGSFDFNQGCTGFVYGLSIAKGLLTSGQASNVLLVTADTYSKYLTADNIACRSIFGDGSSATLITAADAANMRGFVFGTAGKGAEHLNVPHFGLRNMDAAAENKLALHMNGPNIFAFTIDKVPVAVQKLLAKENITLDAIDHVIFHQANAFILEHLRDKLQIPAEKFHTFIETVGNTVSATIPLTIEHLIASETVKHGETLLLVAFGIGLSWNAALIKLQLY